MFAAWSVAGLSGATMRLIGGALLGLLLFGVTYAYAQENEPENSGCLECNVIIWQLRYNHMGDIFTINVGDLETEEECAELIESIDPQTPGFSELSCVPVWVQREKI